MPGDLQLVFRPAARVVLLDPEGHILLFHIVDPRADVPSLWITPGGARESDESYEEAALRELAEETGLTGVALAPCVWQRRHVWRWRDHLNDQVERFFLVRVEVFDVSIAGLEPVEREVTEHHRWWSVEEIAAAREETFVPRRLAELLPPLIAGQVPSEPIDVGV